MRMPAAALLMSLLSLLGLSADVPVRTEQFVYSVIAFNGSDYSPTFVPESSPTIYLLARAESFLSVRKTFVYPWPLTGRLQTDANALNEQLSGSLEVRTGRGVLVRSIPLQRYTFFNVRGEYEQNWKVAVNDAADREYQRSQSLARAFMDSIEQFNRRSREYQATLRRLSDKIETLRTAGKDVSGLMAEMNALRPPAQPAQPREYVVPPAPVQQAFVINLPPGQYRVRFVNPDGSIMEGSDKRIVCYERRRTGQVGYDVIPSDKWTRPEQSATPASVLSVNGKADLYVRPFFQDEMNDLAYEKTVDNAAAGNPNVYSWVRIQQVPHAVLEVRDGAGRSFRLSEQPWTVQQTEGSGLGYTIVPYDPATGKDPDIVAFHVRVGDAAGRMSFRALDDRGLPLPGSERQIRILAPAGRGVIPALLAALPLAVMGAVLALRSRYYR